MRAPFQGGPSERVTGTNAYYYQMAVKGNREPTDQEKDRAAKEERKKNPGKTIFVMGGARNLSPTPETVTNRRPLFTHLCGHFRGSRKGQPRKSEGESKETSVRRESGGNRRTLAARRNDRGLEGKQAIWFLGPTVKILNRGVNTKENASA